MLTQLSVFVENKPGSFRHVTEVLHANAICVQAFCSVDSPEFGILRLVVDQPEAAKACLEKEGFMTKDYDVLAVELSEQKPLPALLAACCESNINILYMYSAYGDNGGRTAVIFYAEYLDETEAMLKGKGFDCLDSLS